MKNIDEILNECVVNKAMQKDKFCLARDLFLECDYMMKVDDVVYCKGAAVFNPDKTKELMEYIYGDTYEKEKRV
jgi:hypothetical protein